MTSSSTLKPGSSQVAWGSRRGFERLSLVEIGQRAGLSLDELRELLEAGSEPISADLNELAERKLPAIEALVERAVGMRDWLLKAQACDCQTLHECELFDRAAVADRPDGRARSPVHARSLN